MNDQKLTARQIAVAIVRDRFTRSMILPNVIPADWFECDVLEITKAGYCVEYEIKVTRGDFFADKNKSRFMSVNGGPRIDTPKLDALGHHDGPARFWYVTPPGLVTLSELPEKAGLIEFTPRHGERVIKRALQLHNNKARPELIRQLRVSAYFKFCRQFIQGRAVNE